MKWAFVLFLVKTKAYHLDSVQEKNSRVERREGDRQL
jgi:hypothetical protein